MNVEVGSLLCDLPQSFFPLCLGNFKSLLVCPKLNSIKQTKPEGKCVCVCEAHSIMEDSLVSRMWSVRIQGMDISMGNWILRPMVSSRKNSRNHSWDRSQQCCRASGGGETAEHHESWPGSTTTAI